MITPTSMSHPNPLSPVEQDEGQCAWCYHRVSDECMNGHNINDHCRGMGYICLPCSDYLWLYTEAKEKKQATREIIECKCLGSSLFDKIYMKINRWWRKREYNHFWENVQQEDLLDDDFLKNRNGNLTCEEHTMLEVIHLEESPK